MLGTKESLNLLQRADPRKRHTENLIDLLHAQSVLSRLNGYDFGATDFDCTTVEPLVMPCSVRSTTRNRRCCTLKALPEGLIVLTIAPRKVLTILQPQTSPSDSTV